MVIGVDAYFLYEKNNTGIGILNLNLLVALSKIDNNNKYVLFTPQIRNKEAALEILKNINFKIIEIKGLMHASRRFWLQSFGLKRRIIKEGIELFWGGGEYIPVLLPKKIQCAVTIHDMVFAIFPETITLLSRISYLTLFRWCLQRANYVFTISENSKKEILRYTKIKKPVYVIYNGIDVNKYACNKKIKKENYILFVGTLQPRKNLINVIKAYAIVAKKIDVDLVIVGASGWKNHEIRYEVETIDSSIKNKIHFMGYIDDKTLVQIYQKALLLCSPSLHEGFGLIILEALVSGTPVVTSKRGAIPEIFKDSVVYADPLSPIDISEKILSIVLDKNIQKKMIKYGKEYAKQFDIKLAAKKYMDLFDVIMGNSSK